MRNFLVNEKGLTLIELLAVFVIGLIFLLIVSNVLVGIHQQYKSQSGEAGEIFDVTYAAKVITKDFRMAKSVDSTENGLEMVIADTGDRIIYDYDKPRKLLKRNGQTLIKEVAEFAVKQAENDMYTIKISSKSGKTVTTELMARNESSNTQSEEVD